MRNASRKRPRVMVVTGATSPLGKVIIRWGIGAGFEVVALSRRTARLSTVPTGSRHRVERLDLADIDAVEAVARRLCRRGASIDLLVNNACGWFPGSILRTPSQTIAAQVTASITGTLVLIRGLAPALRRAKRPIIVNICSTVGSGYRFTPNTLYVVLKGALDAFGRSLRNDLRKHGIRVTNIHFGRLADSPRTSKHIPLNDAAHVMTLVSAVSAGTSVDMLVLTPVEYEY